MDFLHLKYNDSGNKLALPGKTVRIMYQIQDASILDRAFRIMKQKDSRVEKIRADNLIIRFLTG